MQVRTRLFGNVLLFAVALASAAGCYKRRFSGTYATTWGSVRLTQDGDAVSGAYPRGRLFCRIEGEALDCSWEQGEAAGRARFVVREEGFLVGTWGRGQSPTDGGPWLMARQ